ncbi:hypothetical protein N7456_006522 [Penicillium angulare]|uniref:Copper acquisition factor BIM1-like domain-containing protein n=1 Tax=Penicillium angulare TaxID=116970 RepID=A0A9W9KBQ9_9EURO|nr:hypothetical protein N7456_006522 [Penicillium angulare]
MASQLSVPRWAYLLLLLCLGMANAHTIISYPGYRGNNLHTNGTIVGADGLGAAWNKSSESLMYPYGMQWIYPCGGMPTSTNRTKWPVKGGAVAVQPGWFPGHSSGLIYINIGLGTTPDNMSHPVVPVFSIEGPTNNPYPGTFCLPQVPLPANISAEVGQNATIQVVLAAKHGAALYNCVDVTFAEPEDVVEVTRDNCFNSSDLKFDYVYTTGGVNAAPGFLQPNTLLTVVPIVLAAVFGSFV